MVTKDTLCAYCLTHSWVGPPCQRILRPNPDHTMLPLYKYKPVSDTQREVEGKPREVVDFQPKIKIKNICHGTDDDTNVESLFTKTRS